MSSPKTEISVVIPAYNEARVIESTLKSVLSYLTARFTSYEIIVVDDGSTDATVAIVEKIPGVTVVRNGSNRGKGYSVKHGVQASSGALVLFIDADHSTNISELAALQDAIVNADIAIGSRALPGSVIVVPQNPFKRALGRLGNRAIRVMLGLPLHDTQCGFKLFRRSALGIFNQQTIDRFAFDFELLFLASRQNMTIVEVPVRWENNFDSSVTSLDYVRVLLELVRVRYRWMTGRYRVLY